MVSPGVVVDIYAMGLAMTLVAARALYHYDSRRSDDADSGWVIPAAALWPVVVPLVIVAGIIHILILPLFKTADLIILKSVERFDKHNDHVNGGPEDVLLRSSSENTAHGKE